MLPGSSGLNVRSSKLPCFDSLRTEDVSVNLFECVPLVVGSFDVEGVCWATMIKAQNGFRDWNVGGGSSSSIGLVGAVTGVGLIRPLSEWDRRDLVPSRGREGYVVSPKSGERVADTVGGRVEPSPSPWYSQGLPGEVGGRGVNLFWLKIVIVEDGNGEVPLNLSESSLSVPWIPRSRGVVGVVIGANMRSLAPWVCSLGTPYVPHRGAWVLKFGCWGAAFLAGPRGIVSWEVLPTRVVFVGGGIPNRDRSPVKGTGGGRCANRCQVRANSWLSLLEAGDDIVDGEWSISEICPGGSPPSKESQSL